MNGWDRELLHHSVDGELPAEGTGATTVAKPLANVNQYLNSPCSMLTAEQLAGLGLPDEGKAEEGGLGPRCRWFNRESGAFVQMDWDQSTGAGINATYKNSDRYEFVEELTSIDGLPVVAYDSTDDRKSGECNVGVGVTDRIMFQVGLTLSDAKAGEDDPCRLAQEVAKKMVQTMRQGDSGGFGAERLESDADSGADL